MSVLVGDWVSVCAGKWLGVNECWKVNGHKCVLVSDWVAVCAGK